MLFLVQQCECLYDKRSPLNKDKNVKQNAWREIAGELNIHDAEENAQKDFENMKVIFKETTAVKEGRHSDIPKVVFPR